MIHMFHVHKEYDKGVFALQDVELHVEKGEFVFLTGPSGAGKSTLLKLLFCAEQANSGQILVNRRNIHRISKKTIPHFRREIGVIFQDFKLINNRTVFDNVALTMEVLNHEPERVREQVTKILEYLGLGERMEEFPLSLSGGEQQRIAIARALVNEPTLLLADEPTGNLDPDRTWDIMRLLMKFNQAGATILVATHDTDLLMKMGKPIIRLEQGRVVSDPRGRVLEMPS